MSIERSGSQGGRTNIGLSMLGTTRFTPEVYSNNVTGGYQDIKKIGDEISNVGGQISSINFKRIISSFFTFGLSGPAGFGIWAALGTSNPGIATAVIVGSCFVFLAAAVGVFFSSTFSTREKTKQLQNLRTMYDKNIDIHDKLTNAEGNIQTEGIQKYETTQKDVIKKNSELSEYELARQLAEGKVDLIDFLDRNAGKIENFEEDRFTNLDSVRRFMNRIKNNNYF